MRATAYDSYVVFGGLIPGTLCGVRHGLRMHIDRNNDIDLYFGAEGFKFQFWMCVASCHEPLCTRPDCMYTFSSRVL